MKLSDYVVRFVRDLGVRHVFLVPGGGAMHLNESLSRCQDIEFVCNSHEQASAICAEVYSKATNHLGVALVTTGPGATNTITGVAGAWLDSTPCLFISGQVKRADRIVQPDGRHLGVRQMGVQEVDIVSIVRPITKYAVTIDDPQSIRYHLEQGIYLAQSGRPGPVWIDIPLDVQACSIEPETLHGFVPDEQGHPDQQDLLKAQVRRVIELINGAERPVLLAGNGIRLARAEREFQEAVETLNIPVQTTWLAIDLLPENHWAYAGRPGSLAPRGANLVVQNADLLLSVGARLDRVITGYNPQQFARNARKVMVDVDAAEIAKLGDTIDIPICADAGDFLRELLAQANALAKVERREWWSRCRDWKARYPVVLPEHREASGRVSVYYLSEILAEEVADTDHLVSGSSGSGIELFLLCYRVRPGQRVFHTTALGSMGYGLPSAIGACLAKDRRPTVVVDGDGGFQFNIQELETVARLQLPIKFFVLNNDGYASIRASQSSFFERPRIGADAATGLTLPDLQKVARAYNVTATTITEQSNLRQEVRRVLDMPGPVVCDVLMIPDEVRQPRLSSMQLPDGSFVSRPLEDLWPFLDPAELEANMLVPTGV